MTGLPRIGVVASLYTALLPAVVLLVVFSTAERRFHRLALEVCIPGSSDCSWSPLPRAVVRITSVGGFALVVCVFVAVLLDRYGGRLVRVG